MDFLQKIGGRKFIMALITVGVATFIELNSQNGLSATMASFLGGIVAAFSVANYAVSAKHMNSRNVSKGGDGEVNEKLDKLLELNSPENFDNVSTLLTNLSNDISEVKSTYGQIGLAVVNLGRDVQSLKKG